MNRGSSDVSLKVSCVECWPFSTTLSILSDCELEYLNLEIDYFSVSGGWGWGRGCYFPDLVVKLTTYPHLMQRLRLSGSIPLLTSSLHVV